MNTINDAFQALLSVPRFQTLLAVVCCSLAIAFVLLMPSKNAPPGPRFVLPIIGETLDLLRCRPMEFQWKRFKKYGSTVFRVHLLGQWMYVVADPEALRRIMKGDGVGYMIPGGGFPRLIEHAEQMYDRKEHVHWRKYMMLALNTAAIGKLLPDLQRVVDNQLDTWEAKGRLSLMDEYLQMALDFAVDVIAGLDLPPEVERGWFKERITEFIGGLYGLPFDLPGTNMRKALRAKAAVREAFEAAMQQEVVRLKAKVASGGSEHDLKASSMSLFDAQLLSAVGFRDMSVELAHDRMMGNMVAATDTTRYMLWIATCFIAKSPRVLQRLREEQAQVAAEYGPDMSQAALQAMPFLEATVKESMRLLPSTTAVFRVTTKDFPVGNYVIPKGSALFLSTNLPHAIDRNLWDGDTTAPLPPHVDWQSNFDAIFRPERWLPDAPDRAKTYTTFGAGEHLCLGQQLAYTEAKLVIASIIRRFRYSFVDPQWMDRCDYFPGPRPHKGSDMVDMEVDPMGGW